MMDTTTDEKIETLVRSVLEAVDMRLATVRHEMAALTVEAERRHQEVLDHVAMLKRRFDQAQSNAEQADIADLTQRMDQVTEHVMARVEALHHQNADATNARLAALEAGLSALRAGPMVTAPSALTDITGPLPRITPIADPGAALPAPVNGTEPHALAPFTLPMLVNGPISRSVPIVSPFGDPVAEPTEADPAVAHTAEPALDPELEPFFEDVDDALVEPVVAEPVVAQHVVEAESVVEAEAVVDTIVTEHHVEPATLAAPEVEGEASADDLGVIDLDRLTALLSARLELLQLPVQPD